MTDKLVKLRCIANVTAAERIGRGGQWQELEGVVAAVVAGEVLTVK